MKKTGFIFVITVAFAVFMMITPVYALNYVENGEKIPDLNTYRGSWAEAYTQILNNHEQPIRQYENRTIELYIMNGYKSIYCRPVAIEDLDTDGVPELIFMELVSRGGEACGDLYLYSWNQDSASCRLYVPGITQPDYDETLGFHIYCSSYGGNSLVIEYDEYEWPWLLQFSRNALNQYTLINYLHAEFDNSNEGNDRIYRNEKLISETEYWGMREEIQNGKTKTVSDYTAADYSTYGFTYTWAEAKSKLQQNAGGSSAGGSAGTAKNEIYGYTIEKLATRKGPSTSYEDGGTYNVKNQWIRVLSKAWDKRNSIWWVKCEIPYHGKIRVLWTGYKRFDPNTLPLDQLPEETW